LFSDEEVIEATRNWVCVRLDSYESEQHQEWVRRFLNGTFQNSAFCLLSPDGTEWLSKSGRGPNQVFGTAGNLISSMDKIVQRYAPKASSSEAVVQDFHSLRQAINVASADQRVLVLVAGSEEATKPLRDSLRKTAWHEDHVGRFHWDFESDAAVVEELVSKNQDKQGIFLLRGDKFGLAAEVMAELPLDATASELSEALKTTNKEYAATTEKKVYSSHVAEGRKEGIHFEGAVPYGEDRDGDGVIDKTRGKGGKGAR